MWPLVWKAFWSQLWSCCASPERPRQRAGIDGGVDSRNGTTMAALVVAQLESWCWGHKRAREKGSGMSSQRIIGSSTCPDKTRRLSMGQCDFLILLD
ncbi:hypothetical protein GEV33_006652 [Tenebrio molitor]|uniref:Secreted protein n=1 Tax=Tenebrio molitor TaxID=7067 RepID=A0A8J6HK63_TENMO|nr:hypothetical protein GEV33_006652 [Tenebrio molitor]